MNADTIVQELPEGYRWAVGTEVNRFTHPAYYNKMVRVQRGFLGDNIFTDLAILITN